MDDFFTARCKGYDEHMREDVEGDDAFYEFTASLLPKVEDAHILDLGCGTGLELEEYFKVNSSAKVTGIDMTKALKPGGYFILTDYFAELNEQEDFFRRELLRIRKEENLPDGVFYHYDTPLTVEHEKEALLEAGFEAVEILGNWETTYTLKAVSTLRR